MAERPHLPVLRNSRHAVVVVVVVEAVGKWATAALSQLSTCPQPGLHQHLKEPKGHQRIYRMKLALSLVGHPLCARCSDVDSVCAPLSAHHWMAAGCCSCYSWPTDLPGPGSGRSSAVAVRLIAESSPAVAERWLPSRPPMRSQPLPLAGKRRERLHESANARYP